jgi:hypothetical protein
MNFVVQVAAGRRRRCRIPNLVLLPRYQLPRCLARHWAHSDGDTARLNHPHCQLIIELIQRDDGFARSQRRLRGCEVDCAKMFCFAG